MSTSQIPGAFPEESSEYRPPKYIQKMLKKTKKKYYEKLNSDLSTLFMIFVFAEFLKDLSTSKLVARYFVQFIYFLLFDNDSITENLLLLMKTHSIFVIIACNLYCFIYNFVCDLPKHSINGYSTGSWTFQIIGELVPKHKYELYIYDTIIFIIQLLCFAYRHNYQLKYVSRNSGVSQFYQIFGTEPPRDGDDPDDSHTEINHTPETETESTGLLEEQSEYDGHQGTIIVASVSVEKFFNEYSVNFNT